MYQYINNISITSSWSIRDYLCPVLPKSLDMVWVGPDLDSGPVWDIIIYQVIRRNEIFFLDLKLPRTPSILESI
jgi:hypothetical protein